MDIREYAMDVRDLLQDKPSFGGGAGEIPPLQPPKQLNKRSFTMMDEDPDTPEPSPSDIMEAILCCMNMLAALIKKTNAEKELEIVEKA